MTALDHRRRGAQPGNQNARKHCPPRPQSWGFYSQIRTRKENQLRPFALADDNINYDIAALRVTIFTIWGRELDNTRLLVRAGSLLHRMERTQDVTPTLRRQECRRVAESLGQVLDITSKTPHARIGPC